MVYPYGVLQRFATAGKQTNRIRFTGDLLYKNVYKKRVRFNLDSHFFRILQPLYSPPNFQPLSPSYGRMMCLLDTIYLQVLNDRLNIL